MGDHAFRRVVERLQPRPAASKVRLVEGCRVYSLVIAAVLHKKIDRPSSRRSRRPAAPEQHVLPRTEAPPTREF